MADLKISALTASTTPLAGTEILPIVQSSTTKQVSVANLTAGRAMSALSGSFGTGTSAYSISGTQVSATNTSANTYLSVYAGAGASTQGGFLIGANNTENQANILWVQSGNYLQVSANPASSKIKILTAGVDIGDFTTNGFSPTNGRGIDFSATTGTGTSELLNDYEEGTWTPVIADALSGGNTGTCTIVNATYTKVGRQVTVQTLITGLNTTGMTAGNVLFVRGLPFTGSDYAQGNFYTYRVARNASTVSSSVGASASTYVSFRLYTTSSATTDTYILVSNIVSGTSEIGFTLTYTV
jgi:hypothetical protein